MNGHKAIRHGQAVHPSYRLPTFVRLALLVRPWWRGVTLNLTAALLNQGCGIALAVVSALLVARVATGIRADELPPYLAALAVLTIAKAAFTWLDMWLAHNVAYGMLAWLRSSAYNALEPLAPAYTLKRRSGDIVSMATADIEAIELFFAHTLVPLMVMILVPTGLLMGLATVAWPLAVVLLPFLVVVASLPLHSTTCGAASPSSSKTTISSIPPSRRISASANRPQLSRRLRPQRGRPTSMPSSLGYPTATIPSWASGAPSSRAGSASVSPWHAPF